MEEVWHQLPLNGGSRKDAKYLMATINIYLVRSVVAASFLTNTEHCSTVDQFSKIEE